MSLKFLHASITTDMRIQYFYLVGGVLLACLFLADFSELPLALILCLLVTVYIAANSVVRVYINYVLSSGDIRFSLISQSSLV